MRLSPHLHQDVTTGQNLTVAFLGLAHVAAKGKVSTTKKNLSKLFVISRNDSAILEKEYAAFSGLANLLGHGLAFQTYFVLLQHLLVI